MSPAAIAGLLADTVERVSTGHPVRIAVDGPAWTGLDLTGPATEALLARGRRPAVVDAEDFQRPASVRLERGRDDPDAFYESWYDVDALRREVLEPLGPGGSRSWLPSLWDPVRDRATRAAYRTATDSTVVLVCGPFLLGAGLPFDLTVHLAVSPAARRRRVPPDAAARELPAWERYETEVAPATCADIVVRCDDPRHPAVLAKV